jgi:hypothetical protein
MAEKIEGHPVGASVTEARLEVRPFEVDGDRRHAVWDLATGGWVTVPGTREEAGRWLDLLTTGPTAEQEAQAEALLDAQGRVRAFLEASPGYVGGLIAKAGDAELTSDDLRLLLGLDESS